MNISQLLSILYAQKKIIFFTLLVTIGTTLVVSLILPKQFEATTTIIFDAKGVDPVSGYSTPTNMMPGYIETQVNVISSKRVGMKVAEALGLQTNPAYVEAFAKASDGRGDIRAFIAESLLNNLTVEPSRQGSIITISYTSTSPDVAAVVANEFAEQYINTNIELKVEPAQKAAEWLRGQVETLKLNVATAQQKLTDYERQKGILFNDSRFDVERARLNQLTTAQLQSEEKLFDLRAKINAIKQGQLTQANEELVDDPVVNNLKVQLSTAEANFAEIGQRLSENHPDYKSAQAEVKSLQDRYKQELGTVAAKLNESAEREEKRLAELTTKVESQRQKLLSFNEDLNQQEVLARDVEVAKQVLSVAMERMRQSFLEGQVEQSDVAVLNPAITPMQHSKPRLVINLILAVFLGGLLALVFALISEFLNRIVRTKADLEEFLDIPVLAEIPKFSK